MTDPETSPDALNTIIQWAAQRDAIRLVLVTSTRAVPEAHVDALSDYDIILVVQELEPFVADRSWLQDFGEVLVAYWDPVYPDPDYGVDVIGNVTQYTDGLKIDFSVWPVALFRKILAAPALTAELDAGYQVLVDKDHLAAGLLPPTGRAYVPVKPSAQEYQTWVNDFLSDPPYVAKCLWRDELFPAKWCLDCDMIHKYLRQMLEWRVETDHGWDLPVGALGKGLKKRLPVEIWKQVGVSFAGASAAENWEALANVMALFRQVALEVGDYLRYPYPEEMHQKVVAYVEQIRRMPVA
jgi:aminoglycoside 6-adenylyltransferase